MTIVAEISKSELFDRIMRRSFEFERWFTEAEFQKWIKPDMAPMATDGFTHFRLKSNGEIIKTGNIL